MADSDELLEAIHGVRRAVESKTSTFASLVMILIAVAVFSWLGSLADSKLRYEIQYSLDSDQIVVNDKPHNCEFLSAPLGEKHCHFTKDVTVTRWGRSKETHQPVVSYDDGKTWNYFTPPEGGNRPD